MPRKSSWILKGLNTSHCTYETRVSLHEWKHKYIHKIDTTILCLLLSEILYKHKHFSCLSHLIWLNVDKWKIVRLNIDLPFLKTCYLFIISFTTELWMFFMVMKDKCLNIKTSICGTTGVTVYDSIYLFSPATRLLNTLLPLLLSICSLPNSCQDSDVDVIRHSIVTL